MQISFDGKVQVGWVSSFYLQLLTTISKDAALVDTFATQNTHAMLVQPKPITLKQDNHAMAYTQSHVPATTLLCMPLAQATTASPAFSPTISTF